MEQPRKYLPIVLTALGAFLGFFVVALFLILY